MSRAWQGTGATWQGSDPTWQGTGPTWQGTGATPQGSGATWQGTGASKELPKEPKPETFKTPTAGDTLIKVYTADITRLDVDAVVNASNENLKHLGGVAYALLAAAGPQLQTACDEYLYQLHLKELPVGNVMRTPGFNLRARFVIHAVGPNGHACRDEQQFRQLLETAISNTFREAQTINAITLALPLISAGMLCFLP